MAGVVNWGGTRASPFLHLPWLAFMPDMTARTPMTVTTLFRRTTLATSLLLALAGCSVMTPYKVPASALEAPLEQNSGWHLASSTEREAAANQSQAGQNGAVGQKTGTADKAASRGTDPSAAGGPSGGTGGDAGRPPDDRIAVVSLIDGAAFQDPVLKDLLQRLQSGNLSMVQAEARLRQAQATLSGAGAARLPQVGVNVQGGRSGSKGSITGRSSSGGNAGALSALGLDQDTLSQLGGNGKGATNNVQAGTTISWAPDLWGKVSAQVESGRAAVQAAEANRRAAELQAQVSLIQAYWRMRLAEAQLILQARSEATSERSLQLTRNQYQAGLVTRADVVQAETSLQSVVTQRHALERSRDAERHAIAVLLGLPPSSLSAADLAPTAMANTVPGGKDASAPPVMLPAVPAIPETLSIDLLRRRPDVRVAERQVAAANADVGVARGAWLPDLTFSTTGTLSSATVANLLSSPLRSWSVGAQLAQTLFDGGTRNAALKTQEAAYDEKVAAYRLQVLTALQEIEDGLLSRRTLANQETDQQRLVSLAQEAERVVRNRYQGGVVSYAELASAESTSLNAQSQLLSVQADRLNNYITLLAAVGGSWQLP
ncbi:efflux transporter, outer membrane factor lipoprotein, NodT family [Lautropia mirabilis ATCC 51599]|uniref:Efflux transporter, outer membrane factor lipoprotein, NodT family n=2 Tax=Lautropia mirabilis TaxID=47671 RepID=E7RTX7_9BURK|nr:efflux transporter, outer membrane factor lipoprotein, NodT family [Lautropia mirabilis ATCC 51599]